MDTNQSPMKATQYTVSDFNAQLGAGAFAWPGGYPVYFVTSDCEAMSFEYARANADLIRQAIAENDTRSSWHVLGADINWEDASLYCCGNNKRIPSAYAEDEVSE